MQIFPPTEGVTNPGQQEAPCPDGGRSGHSTCNTRPAPGGAACPGSERGLPPCRESTVCGHVSRGHCCLPALPGSPRGDYPGPWGALLRAESVSCSTTGTTLKPESQHADRASRACPVGPVLLSSACSSWGHLVPHQPPTRSGCQCRSLASCFWGPRKQREQTSTPLGTGQLQEPEACGHPARLPRRGAAGEA